MPIITINNLPNDIPEFRGIGSLSQRGVDNTEVGDSCHFDHYDGTTTMTIQSYRFLGGDKPGWVSYIVPGIY